MTKEFDFSKIQEPERVEKFIEVYNGLDEGESIIVSGNDNFKQNILDIQAAIEGHFFWAAIHLGPPVSKGVFVNFKTALHMSQSITRYMGFDHRRCDELYAEGESKILAGDLEEGLEIMGGFIVGMERHFKIEETILFPTFEETTGMTQGPTQVMRMEHEQMKAIMQQMRISINSQSGEQVTGLGETMLVLMQQHNMKEEQMLYFMMEQHLSHLAEGLIKAAKKIDL